MTDAGLDRDAASVPQIARCATGRVAGHVDVVSDWSGVPPFPRKEEPVLARFWLTEAAPPDEHRASDPELGHYCCERKGALLPTGMDRRSRR